MPRSMAEWQSEIDLLSTDLGKLNERLQALPHQPEKKQLQKILSDARRLHKKYARLGKSLERVCSKFSVRDLAWSHKLMDRFYVMMGVAQGTAEEINKVENRISEALKAIK